MDVLRQSDKVRQAPLQQWSQLGRRSLFDVMSTEGDHFNLRVAYVNALYDGYLANSLTPFVGDANSQTPEFKAFLVDIEKVPTRV